VELELHVMRFHCPVVMEEALRCKFWIFGQRCCICAQLRLTSSVCRLDVSLRSATYRMCKACTKLWPPLEHRIFIGKMEENLIFLHFSYEIPTIQRTPIHADKIGDVMIHVLNAGYLNTTCNAKTCCNLLNKAETHCSKLYSSI
jgi:hypothetical protein